MPEGKRNGFDFLAPFYDQLARFIFGDAVRKSQTHFLSSITPNTDILILGGGTGWIIEEILQRQQRCHIWFVDSSPGMIDQAVKNNPGDQPVTYVCGTTNDIPDRKYAVIILPFFLDLFSTGALKKNILSIAAASNSETNWIITDFVNQGKWWQRMLLTLMYYFFRVVCKLDAARLPDWRNELRELAFTKLESESFYRGFIESHRYQLTRDIKH